MKLTHEQAVHGANVFSDYFDKFGRIDEYMREQKQRKELLLFNYGIEGLVKLDQSNEESFEIAVKTELSVVSANAGRPLLFILLENEFTNSAAKC